jgi:hypothetical protein
MPTDEAMQFKRWRQTTEKAKDTPRNETPLSQLSERMMQPISVEEILFLQDNNVRAAQAAARGRRIAREHKQFTPRGIPGYYPTGRRLGTVPPLFSPYINYDSSSIFTAARTYSPDVDYNTEDFGGGLHFPEGHPFSAATPVSELAAAKRTIQEAHARRAQERTE